MSILYSDNNGWFVSQLDYLRKVYLSDLNQTNMEKYTMKCFSDMLDIESPFLKDEQFDKLKAQVSFFLLSLSYK
ncbi:hypothetical protein WDU94_005476 [Cyamophila willieti]